MKYELEWQYSDDPEQLHESAPYLHFNFVLFFPEVPPGKGYAEHFAFNVLRKPETNESGISLLRRGFLQSNPFSKPSILEFVEKIVAEAFEKDPGIISSIAHLDERFIHTDADFSGEFAGDLIEADELLELINQAFDRVERGEGMTLHQAVVVDDYGSEEEFTAAGELDLEDNWQDVPDSDLAENTSIFCFLDPPGFRYYLPAAMSFAVKDCGRDVYDSSFFTYLAVLPTVAPRDSGRGFGAAFDLDAFIQRYSFTALQVETIYRFICFMAIRAHHGMDEDQYAAAKKWRQAALSQ